MKIGILVTSIGNFGSKGLYNSQESGLAKSLSPNKVIIYKFVLSNDNNGILYEKINDNVEIKYIPCKSIGTHGISNLKFMNPCIEVLIYFSDIQIMLPKVYRWCKRNKIKLLPYIGVIKSNSKNKKVSLLTNIFRYVNLKIYKQCDILLVKNKSVKLELIKSKIKNISVFPVGLDSDLLKINYSIYDRNKIRNSYNLRKNDKVILFVGRLEMEKNPLKAVDIFYKLTSENKSYKMIMVGKGRLEEEVIKKIDEYEISKNVLLIESIKNEKIWELYYISDYFINLCRNEIFGMAILEAMYYKCLVIANKAPGPDEIIDNGINGYLVDDEIDIINIIKSEYDEEIVKAANKKVKQNFMWNKANEIIN